MNEPDSESRTRPPRQNLRVVLPLLVTAGRLIAGAVALVLALEGGNLLLVATLLTLGAAIGGLCELVVWWKAASVFASLFAGLADYLAVIVAPWVLTRAILISPRSLVQEALLDLPLLTGAIQGARRGVLATGQGHAHDHHGLSAVFYAFAGITVVLLRLPEVLSATQLANLLIPLVAALSLLMVAPLRYPRLTEVPRLSVIVLVLVALMPFVQTERLTAAAIVLGVMYVVLGPLLPDRRT